MMQPQIDFEAMEVGDKVELGCQDWEGEPRRQFEAARDFTATHQDRQFEVTNDWRLNKTRGIEERHFVLTRTR